MHLEVLLLSGFCLCTASSGFLSRFNFPAVKEEKNESLFVPPVMENLVDEEDLGNRIASARSEMLRNLEGLSWNIDKKEKPPHLVEEKKIIEIYDDTWDQIGSANDLGEVGLLLGLDLEEEYHKKIEENLLLENIPLLYSHNNESSVLLQEAKSSSQNSNYWTNPKRAGCQPDITPVELKLRKSRNVIYFPTCVRVNRCGGCCTSKAHQCQPVAVKDITVKVIQVSKMSATYNGGGRLQRSSNRRSRRRRSSKVEVNSVNATIEEHTACNCLCKLKESECDLTVHVYNDRICTCDCLNSDDEAKCLDESKKFWNKRNCLCECRHTTVCTTGYEFDHRECKCGPIKANLVEAGILILE